MHRTLAFVIVFMSAAAAAVMWPTPVLAADASAIEASTEVETLPASAVADAARTTAPARAEVGRETGDAERPDVVVSGPAETTRLLRAHLHADTAPPATFACRSADRAVFDVAAGAADAAIVTMPFEQILGDARLREQTLCEFVVMLVRHRDNHVDNLTRAQLQALCRGRIRSWADLGGERRELCAFSTFTGPADEARALGLGQGVACVRERGLSLAQVVERVARDPGALGIVAVRAVPEDLPCLAVDGVAPSLSAFASGTYPMGYRLRLVHRASPRAPLAALLTFLRGAEGQRVLRDLAP